MRIAELYDRHVGRDIYIVGTGPSLRFFPIEWLSDKITIGLNQAFKHFEPKYSITVHPEHVIQCEQDPRKITTRWITKRKPPLDKLSFDDPRYYVFDTAELDFDVTLKRKPDTLFIGRGVQQTAMDMAARMGAANIFLVGIDMTDVGGDHHAHDQHVRFHGLAPVTVYAEYRKYTAMMRETLRKLRVNVLSLSPYLSAVGGEEDHARLLVERNLQKLPPPIDTSKYRRAVPAPIVVKGKPHVQRKTR